MSSSVSMHDSKNVVTILHKFIFLYTNLTSLSAMSSTQEIYVKMSFKTFLVACKVQHSTMKFHISHMLNVMNIVFDIIWNLDSNHCNDNGRSISKENKQGKIVLFSLKLVTYEEFKIVN